MSRTSSMLRSTRLLNKAATSLAGSSSAVSGSGAGLLCPLGVRPSGAIGHHISRCCVRAQHLSNHTNHRAAASAAAARCPVSEASAATVATSGSRTSSPAPTSRVVSPSRSAATSAHQACPIHTTRGAAARQVSSIADHATLSMSAAAAAAGGTSGSGAETAVASASGAWRTVQELKGPKTLPLIGNFHVYVKKENRGRLHEVQAEQHREFGPMFREKLGPRYQVHLSDPDLIETVLRNQGRYPIRSSFNSWKVYRRVTGEEFGILTSEGADWQRIRSVLSKRMLKPKLAGEHAPHLNSVVGDMITRIRMLRDDVGNDELTKQLPFELYKWAMESIGTVLFETRMGCLEPEIPTRVTDFIDAITKMMASSLQIIIMDELHRKLNTRFWRRHKEAWDTLFEITRSFVDARLEEIDRTLAAGPEVEDGAPAEFLSFLLSSKQLSMKEIYANMTECMIGGVDTTSNTLCFALYLLAKNPQAQEKLHTEVTSLIGNDVATFDDVKKMPYLKCIIKETLRLYPVVTMNVRQIDEDIVLNGTLVPRDTLFVLNHYAACRDDAIFDNAEEFIPERWQRMDEKRAHAFAALPFGYGTRSCVGRRIAELELYLVLARMAQQFRFDPIEGASLKPELRTVLTPGEAGVPVIFTDR